MADLYISYARRDKEFTKRVYEGLSHHNYDIWIDWKDIPPIADWWQEIQKGIEDAHTFILILSPSFLESPVYLRELDHAVAHNKRIIPVVCESVTSLLLPPEVSRINWIFARQQDDFKQAFASLIPSH